MINNSLYNLNNEELINLEEKDLNELYYKACKYCWWPLNKQSRNKWCLYCNKINDWRKKLIWDTFSDINKCILWNLIAKTKGLIITMYTKSVHEEWMILKSNWTKHWSLPWYLSWCKNRIWWRIIEEDFWTMFVHRLTSTMVNTLIYWDELELMFHKYYERWSTRKEYRNKNLNNDARKKFLFKKEYWSLNKDINIFDENDFNLLEKLIEAWVSYPMIEEFFTNNIISKELGNFLNKHY